MQSCLHHAHCRLPLLAAHVIHYQPQLVAAAVHALSERLPSDMKVSDVRMWGGCVGVCRGVCGVWRGVGVWGGVVHEVGWVYGEDAGVEREWVRGLGGLERGVCV